MKPGHLTKHLVKHLTDEQFSELIAGQSATQDALAHLNACEDCQAELQAVSSGIQQFRTFSLLWAELQAPKRVPVPSPWAVRFGGIPRWSMAAAALVIVGAAVGIHQEKKTVPEVQMVVVADTATAPSSSVLAEDNRLLMSIDQELSSEVRPPVPVSELQVQAGSAHRTTLRRFVD